MTIGKSMYYLGRILNPRPIYIFNSKLNVGHILSQAQLIHLRAFSFNRPFRKIFIMMESVPGNDSGYF